MAEWWRSALGIGRDPSADQETAIVAPATGRHSVNAGAGTGKTSTLALRALYLIEAGNIRANQIVVLTFTKKAAAEVGSRITDTIDRAAASGARFADDGQGVECTTIHALAARILREFAFEFGLITPPRAISDGEAHRIFHEAFSALLDGRIAVDARAFPLAEVDLGRLERDLGKLALRLKNHGITPAAFASRALVQANLLGDQTWGQLWAAGARDKRKELNPKVPVTTTERALEAERERRNILLVTALFTEFDRRLEQADAATYGDLIGTTTRLLRERPAVVTRLRSRWRYLLLDESQDTSLLQLAFIETLFGKPGDIDAAGMMPVGDTRQAIYGFNGADEQVMERFTATADATHPLVVNRRSSQEIVDAGHAVLQHAGILDTTTPQLQAAIGSRGLGCIRVENFGESGETVKEHVEREAAAIAREVRRLVSDNSVMSRDIAILVRRRTHAAAYVRALNKQGIAAALDRRTGLFVTDEVRDVIAWMSWLLDLGDDQAAVRVLQSPVCGLNDATLIALTASKDWLNRIVDDNLTDLSAHTDTRFRLDRIRTLITELLPVVAIPLPKAIQRILAELPVAASYARLGDTVGAQAIANLRGFEELAVAFAEQQPDARLRDFVDDVRRRILYDDDPQEAELDVDGVRILTIHQAKGLEWAFVFVACSTKAQYANAEPTDRVINYDLRSGAFAIKNDVDGRETFHWLTLMSEHDPATGERRERSERKEAAEREQARVFYVALTRAKERVYVTAPAPNPGNGSAKYLAALRAWAESMEAGVNLCFDATLLTDTAPVVAATAVRHARAIERTPLVVQRRPSTLRPRISFTAISAYETCPRMARYRYRLELTNLREEVPRFVGLDPNDTPLFTNAARLGSLTHRALEIWGRAQIQSHAMQSQSIVIDEAFASALLEFTNATPNEIDRARLSARHGVRALENYALLDVETPFEIGFGEVRVEGVIDLVARDPNSKLLVIDYKTGRTESDHYALQMALYREVVASRHPNEAIDTLILRLSADAAVFSNVSPLPYADLEKAITEAGLFESDVAKVGPWCTFCSYRGSPCMAPLATAV